MAAKKWADLSVEERRKGIVTLFIVCALIVVLIRSMGPILPDQQRAFERARLDLATQYESAPNNLQEEALAVAAAKSDREWASKTGGQVDGWKAVVTRVHMNPLNDRLQVYLGSGGSTMPVTYVAFLEPGHPLFGVAAKLGNREPVVFSGTLTRTTDGGLREFSFTQSGGMTRPEFIIELKSLALR